MIGDLRWNPLARRWVAVAGHRSGRPIDEHGRTAPPPARPRFDPDCPFCPGNEDETLAPLVTIPAATDAPWQLRVVPNKYPSFDGIDPLPQPAPSSGPHPIHAPASGTCEVVVFTPDHDRDLADCSPALAALLLAVTADRCRSHAGMGAAVRHTSVILNRGRTSGASLLHPHAQLLGTPFVPPTVETEVAAFRTDPTVVADLVRPGGRGIVVDRSEAVSVCPPWAGFPYESWIVPRAGTRSITDAPDAELEAVGDLLVDGLHRLRTVLGDVDYNVAVRLPPVGSDDPFAWYVQILPRHVPLAGFELSAGIPVNAVPPEDAAEHLRSAGPVP